MNATLTERAARMRDHVKAIWDPPAKAPGTYAQVGHTMCMLTLAVVFGREFLGELTELQERAIRAGLAGMEDIINE